MEEYYFFLLVQHCWAGSIVVVVLGDVCKTAGAHCLQDGNKGERGGEGQKEQLLGVDPPISAFLSLTSMFLVW